jgi:hypothetical protein
LPAAITTTMKNLLRFCLVPFLTLLAAAPPAAAQITFTVTAIADNTVSTAAQSYIAGHAYTFVYTLTPDYPQNHNYSQGENNDWFEKYITNEAALFTAVGGTGLGGTYIDPIETAGSPFSFVRAYNGNFLGLYAGADAGDIGVTTLAGTTLTHVIASMNLAEIDFARPASYTNPATYFAPYVGEYHAWGGTVGLYGGGFDGATFQVIGVNIGNNTVAIPEPSTYAALFGLGVLGVAAWRRQKRKLKLES